MILVFSIASAGFVLTRVPPSPVSLDSTTHTSVIPSTFVIDLGIVSASTESPETRSTNFMHVSDNLSIPPLHTPVLDRIFSLNIPSIWKHDDDNVSPVLEWDGLFEEPLLLIDPYPLVHLSSGDFMGVPSVPSERDAAHHTLTKVFIHLVSATHILDYPFTLKGYP